VGAHECGATEHDDHQAPFNGVVANEAALGVGFAGVFAHQQVGIEHDPCRQQGQSPLMHVGVVLDRVASKFHALDYMHKNMH